MTGPNPFAGALEPRPSQSRGMFGVRGSPDVSGYGGLVRRPPPLPSTPRPYGGLFDEVVDALGAALETAGHGFDDAIERVVVDRGELTMHVRPQRLLDVARPMRNDPRLRFELLSSLSGVHYPVDTARELHVVYHLTSMTNGGRRVRLEVAVPDADPRLPSVYPVWPTCDWQERETWDMFGVVFEGHPALTRILMPDDWPGHPQRKDYPLGGVPVEYKGAHIPPPDARRSYA